MAGKTLTIEQIVTMLAAAPSRIAAATADLVPAQLRAAIAPGEWSANEILAHLRSCADMWGGSITKIIAEDKPTIRAINPRTWLKNTDYLDLEFQPSLHAFTAQRSELMALLEPLPSESWARTATVSVAGKPFERSVFFYAEWLATHERSHLKQIERIGKTLRT